MRKCCKSAAIDFRMQIISRAHSRAVYGSSIGQRRFERSHCIDKSGAEFSLFPSWELHTALTKHALKNERKILTTIACKERVSAVMGQPHRGYAGCDSSCE